MAFSLLEALQVAVILKNCVVLVEKRNKIRLQAAVPVIILLIKEQHRKDNDQRQGTAAEKYPLLIEVQQQQPAQVGKDKGAEVFRSIEVRD